jgi:hypothetical protein
MIEQSTWQQRKLPTGQVERVTSHDEENGFRVPE